MKTEFSWDSELLKDLTITEYDASFDEKFSLTNPESGIEVRPLSQNDYDKGSSKINTRPYIPSFSFSSCTTYVFLACFKHLNHT